MSGTTGKLALPELLMIIAAPATGVMFKGKPLLKDALTELAVLNTVHGMIIKIAAQATIPIITNVQLTDVTGKENILNGDAQEAPATAPPAG